MWKDQSKTLFSHYLYQTFLCIAIGCAAILFMPQSMLVAIKLTYVLDKSAHIVGLLFIASSTYLIVDLCITIIGNKKDKARQSQLSEQIQDRIKTLTSSERAVLREFYLQRQTSLWLPSHECEVKSLLSSGVLIAVDYYTTNRFTEDGIKETELMISHIARQHLTKSRLKLPQGKPNGDDITYLKLARPSFLVPVAELKRSA